LDFPIRLVSAHNTGIFLIFLLLRGFASPFWSPSTFSRCAPVAKSCGHLPRADFLPRNHANEMKGSDAVCKEDFHGPGRTQQRKLRTAAFYLLTQRPAMGTPMTMTVSSGLVAVGSARVAPNLVLIGRQPQPVPNIGGYKRDGPTSGNDQAAEFVVACA
jgi:hypothetical protein